MKIHFRGKIYAEDFVSGVVPVVAVIIQSLNISGKFIRKHGVNFVFVAVLHGLFVIPAFEFQHIQGFFQLLHFFFHSFFSGFEHCLTDLIRENLERMNRRNVEVQVYDATVHDPEKEKYADVVLMDVPCSGLGVMGKKRDIKYHATPESLQSITELQRQIVAAGWQYVKPHGVLLYSTCTIHRGENQEMAVWITENFPFVLEEERQLLPGTDETDGFYYARLRRKV